MSDLYDDAMVDAVHAFAWRAIDGHSGAGSARAAAELLDSIAPLIAAKALRDTALYWAWHPSAVDDETPADCRNWLRDRADEIERS